MLLYIIRHGDPDYATDSLTERGVLQAEAVGKRMADAGITRIFSSPMGRIFIAHMLHIPLHMMWAGFNYTHSGVSIIEFKNSKIGYCVPRLLCYSDMSHLYAAGLDMKYCGRTEI